MTSHRRHTRGDVMEKKRFFKLLSDIMMLAYAQGWSEEKHFLKKIIDYLITPLPNPPLANKKESEKRPK